MNAWGEFDPRDRETLARVAHERRGINSLTVIVLLILLGVVLFYVVAGVLSGGHAG